MEKNEFGRSRVNGMWLVGVARFCFLPSFNRWMVVAVEGEKGWRGWLLFGSRLMRTLFFCWVSLDDILHQTLGE